MESDAPIINALKEVSTYIRWCTPSVLPDQENVHIDNTGIFEEAHKRDAEHISARDPTLNTIYVL